VSRRPPQSLPTKTSLQVQITIEASSFVTTPCSTVLALRLTCPDAPAPTPSKLALYSAYLSSYSSSYLSVSVAALAYPCHYAHSTRCTCAAHQPTPSSLCDRTQDYRAGQMCARRCGRCGYLSAMSCPIYKDGQAETMANVQAGAIADAIRPHAERTG